MTMVIGLVLLVLPGPIGETILTTYASGSNIFIQFLGSSLIGYSFLNWYTSKHRDPTLMHATLIGNFSTLMIALALSIIGVLGHSLKTAGLLIILLHLSVGAGFGYYLHASRTDKK